MKLSIITDNITIIQVLTPLLLSFICSLQKNHIRSWLFTLIVLCISFSISVIIMYRALSGEIMTYTVGGWPSTYGIEIKIDLLSSIIVMLVNFIALISLLYSFHINVKELSPDKLPKFYNLFLLSFAGLLGITVSNDVFNIYVFLEVLSISSYILVTMGPTRSSLIAGFEYLIIGSVGATFYLIGVGFLYAETGTLNISDLKNIIENLESSKMLNIGIIFVILGLSTKAALFPFHKWLVKAYSNSPSFISVFFSGTTTKVMIYIIMKMIYSAFSPQLTFTTLKLDNILIFCSSCAIIFASLSAMENNKLKEILSYSSISQIGYIFLAISLNTINSLTAAIITIISHSIIKCGLFMVSEHISRKNARSNLSFPIVVLSLGLIGFPLTSGFISKWYLLLSVFQHKYYLVSIVVLIGSLLSLGYTWKIFEVIYNNISESQSDDKKCTEVVSSKISLTCIWITVLITIFNGVYPYTITSLAKRISLQLLIQ